MQTAVGNTGGAQYPPHRVASGPPGYSPAMQRIVMLSQVMGFSRYGEPTSERPATFAAAFSAMRLIHSTCPGSSRFANAFSE